MFRIKFKKSFSPFFACVLPRVEVLENGSVDVVFEEQNKFVLPDPSVTRLGELLAAGVDIRKVNTKLFTPSEISSEVVQEIKQSEVKE